MDCLKLFGQGSGWRWVENVIQWGHILLAIRNGSEADSTLSYTIFPLLKWCTWTELEFVDHFNLSIFQRTVTFNCTLNLKNCYAMEISKLHWKFNVEVDIPMWMAETWFLLELQMNFWSLLPWKSSNQDVQTEFISTLNCVVTFPTEIYTKIPPRESSKTDFEGFFCLKSACVTHLDGIEFPSCCVR